MYNVEERDLFSLQLDTGGVLWVNTWERVKLLKNGGVNKLQYQNYAEKGKSKVRNRMEKVSLGESQQIRQTHFHQFKETGI